MARVGGDMLMYETTLSSDARQQIKRLGHADVLIGIPTHRNAKTIGEVADAVAEGVGTFLPEQRVVLMNADGGSSDNTVRYLEELSTPGNMLRLLTEYRGTTGKGTAVCSILEAAALLDVKACLLLEARAPGIAPEWIPALVNPVLTGDDMAFACYQRSAFASALTDNLVYPFLRTFFRSDLREPLAGEFCVSGKMARDLAGRDVWETNVAKFGINVWPALCAVTEDVKVSQVAMGERGEGSWEPGAMPDARFWHIVGALFRTLTTHRRLWRSELPPRHVPYRGGRCEDRRIACRDCEADLIKSMQEAHNEWHEEWERVLTEDTCSRVEALLDLPVQEFRFSADLWARVALEFAAIHNRGEGDPDKVADALLPLFYGRAATYLQDSWGLTVGQREELVAQILQAFAEQKPHFIRLWDSLQSWDDDVSPYWVP